MTDQAAYLGVGLSDRTPLDRPTAKKTVWPGRMAQGHGFAPALCRTLSKRGNHRRRRCAFLAPTLRDLLPRPRSLRDMEKAATRFFSAVKARERIAVFADTT